MHPVSQDRKYFLLWVQLKSLKTPGWCLPVVVFWVHMRQVLSSHVKSPEAGLPIPQLLMIPSPEAQASQFTKKTQFQRQISWKWERTDVQSYWALNGWQQMCLRPSSDEVTIKIIALRKGGEGNEAIPPHFTMLSRTGVTSRPSTPPSPKRPSQLYPEVIYGAA